MEFFAEADVNCNVEKLYEALTIAALPRFCREISRVFRDGDLEGEIYCLWGCFVVHREKIREGVRFTLPKCPNALAWTITRNGEFGLMIHCTINRRVHDPDFIESIESFIFAWKEGLEEQFG